MPSPSDEAIPLATGSHYDEIVAVEVAASRRAVAAHEEARRDLSRALTDLWRLSFTARERPPSADVIRWLRSPGVERALDEYHERIGLQTRAGQSQGWVRGVETGSRHTSVELGIAVAQSGEVGSVFVSPRTVQFDDRYLAAVANSENVSLLYRQRLQASLLEGALAGEGITKLRRRAQTIAAVNANRADLAIRWAVMAGYNAARHDGLLAVTRFLPGIQKMWIAARDDRVCPHCAAHHGEVVDVIQPFDASRTFAEKPLKPYGTLDYPPAHPRCRCTVTPWSEDWRKFSRITPELLQEQARSDARANGFL